MLFILPPSETKRSGGDAGSRLDFDALSYPELSPHRRVVAEALLRISDDPEASLTALKIGPRLRAEVDRNRALEMSPTCSALRRYTGVAYDPIPVNELDEASWLWAADHVAIHSALFGLVGAADKIPAYRLSHDSRIPGLRLKDHWSEPLRRLLAARPGPIVDLRSEGYATLGPAPVGSAFVRIVSDADGRRRALNHFNKKTKGLLTARLLASRPELASLDEVVEWARGEGIAVDRAGDELIVVAESLLQS